MGKKKLGELLRERGHISTEDLAKALDEQNRKVMLLGEVLLQRNLVKKQNLVTTLEEVTRVPYVDALSAQCEPAALKLVPHAVALRHCVLPLAVDGQTLVAVMAAPQNLHTIDELCFVTGRVISPRLGFRSEILAALEKYYGGSPNGPKVEPEEEAALFEHPDAPQLQFFSVSSRQSNQKAMKEIQAELQTQPTPAVRLVSSAIAAAIAKDASDIHIEPHGSGLVVRLRVDGVFGN